jgi:hypothetical protein
MTTPRVTEIVVALQAVEHDEFIDDLARIPAASAIGLRVEQRIREARRGTIDQQARGSDGRSGRSRGDRGLRGPGSRRSRRSDGAGVLAYHA